MKQASTSIDSTSDTPRRQNRIAAHLTISSVDLEPSALTQLIGREPSTSWKCGEIVGKSIRRYEKNGWRVSSGLPESADVEAHVDDVLRSVADHVGAIAGVAHGSRVELALVIYGEESVPEIHLRHDQVEALARMRAAVDVDFYCLMNE